MIKNSLKSGGIPEAVLRKNAYKHGEEVLDVVLQYLME